MEAVASASSVAGLAAVSFHLFEGCVKGFVLLSAAHGFGSRAEIFACQLEWEHYHLHRWATLAGLFQNPPELNVPNVPLVERTLRNLEQILTNADKLQEDYDLKIESTEKELEAVHSTHLFGSFVKASSEKFVNDTAKVFQRRNSPWKKLKWAAFSQNQFAIVLQDVREFNRQLQSTLHWVEQGLYSGNSCDALRSVVAQASDNVRLEIVTRQLDNLDRAIQAAARLKRRGLLLEVLETSSAGASTSKARRFPTHRGGDRQMLRQDGAPVTSLEADFRCLQLSQKPVAPDVRHEVATYDGKTVILEWKYVPVNMDRRLKHRVAAVAELLSGMSDESFHSLECIGYLKEAGTPRYAYMFKPPLDVDFSIVSLADLTQTSNLRSSMNDRLKIAINVTETVLQLHTAGWLHKSIRSSNILFFRSTDEMLSGTHTLPGSYLAGYEFARLDNILETTEAPGSHEPALIYRHPLSLSQDRFPYCKAFDLYSLGWVLLEIGLWRPIPTVLFSWIKHTTSPSPDADYDLPSRSQDVLPIDSTEWNVVFEHKEAFVQSAQDGRIAIELRYSMGDAYADVVKRCLNAASGLHPGGNNADTETFLTVQMECLKTLRSCADHV